MHVWVCVGDYAKSIAYGLRVVTMSFYHVLPSNSSTEAFPGNTASQYRTLMAKPYRLDGDWEVAVLGLTHSNCINTFNNDVVELQEETKRVVATEVKSPTEIAIDWSNTSERLAATASAIGTNDYHESLIADINSTLRGIIVFKCNKTPSKEGFVSYKFDTNKFALLLDETLSKFLCTYDVITPGDEWSRRPPPTSLIILQSLGSRLCSSQNS